MENRRATAESAIRASDATLAGRLAEGQRLARDWFVERFAQTPD